MVEAEKEIGAGLLGAREIFSHVQSPFERLRVFATDEAGAGGAHHHYQVIGITSPEPVFAKVNFQNGTVLEQGVNGVSEAAILAVLIDRLRGFQAGPYSCRENAIALTHLEDALHWLHHRTAERIRRGAEGRSIV